jgi:hypothetical protein
MIEGRTGGGQNYFGDSTAKGVRFQSALTHHEVPDADSGPVEVSVVRKARAASDELPKQSLLSRGRHAVRADQRRAVHSQLVRCDGENRRVFANVYPRALPQQMRSKDLRLIRHAAGHDLAVLAQGFGDSFDAR